jgi:septum site-determining protein MinC
MSIHRIEGGIFAVAVVGIGDPYDPALAAALKEQVRTSPGFYADAPVVLDLKEAHNCDTVADIVALRTVLRRHGLMLVGVRNASEAQLRAARAVDLAHFPAAASSSRRGEAAQPAAAPAKAGDARGRTRLVTRPVRSGTQIYARDGDLVVVAPVSAGAELVADGHVHVYGALRGRAIAGARGDGDARIFVQRLEAELLAIAGRYMVNEAIPPERLKRPAQVALAGDRLEILPGLEGEA